MSTFYENLNTQGEDKKAEVLLKVILQARLEDIRAIEVPEEWTPW